jgi:hypothetical protein
MCMITLADGTQLKDVMATGNRYIANEIISDDVFKNNLSRVTITEGNETETYTDMTLESSYIWGDKSCFVLKEKPQHNRINERIDKITQGITDIEVALAEIYETLFAGQK